MLDNRFIGRIAMTDKEVEFLSRKIQEGDFYLEIGTLWGGSAIVAGLAGAKRVVSIDNQEFHYWTKGDPKYHGKLIGTDILRLNADRYGLDIEFVKADSMEHDFTQYDPDIVFIDGNHKYEWIVNDWNVAKSISKRAILVHDFESAPWPDVARAMSDVDTNGWRRVKQVGSLVMYERGKVA